MTLLIDNNNDIDQNWTDWKDTFLADVADNVPTKKLKGRNPVPWINSAILNLKKKRDNAT